MSVCTDTTPHICVIQYMNFRGEYEAEALSAAEGRTAHFHICGVNFLTAINIDDIIYLHRICVNILISIIT